MDGVAAYSRFLVKRSVCSVLGLMTSNTTMGSSTTVLPAAPLALVTKASGYRMRPSTWIFNSLPKTS